MASIADGFKDDLEQIRQVRYYAFILFLSRLLITPLRSLI
jgi:hypothetical protein